MVAIHRMLLTDKKESMNQRREQDREETEDLVDTHKVMGVLLNHITDETTWRESMLSKIECIERSVKVFQTKYEPTLSTIVDRTNYWSGVRDTVIRSVAVAFVIALLASLGSAIFLYIKHLFTK